MRKLQQTVGDERSEIRCIGEDKGNSFTLITLLSPKDLMRDPLSLRFLWKEKVSVRGNDTPPQLCGTLPKSSTTVSPHQEYWDELHNWGVERSLENSRRSLEIIKGTQILLLLFRVHQKAHPWATGDASPANHPNGPIDTPNAMWELPIHIPTLWPAPHAYTWEQHMQAFVDG